MRRLTFFSAILPSASPLVLEYDSDGLVGLPTSGYRARLMTIEGDGPITPAPISAKGPSQEGETALDVTIPPRILVAQARVDAASRLAYQQAMLDIAAAMVSIPVRFGEQHNKGRLLYERTGMPSLEIDADPRSAVVDDYIGTPRGMLDAEWYCPYPYWRDIADSTLTVPDATTGITGDAGTDIITAADHDLAVGDQVKFSGLVGGTGLASGTIYYIIAGSFTTGQFKVSATSGGAAVNFTTNITDGTVQKITTAANAGHVDAPITALIYGPATEVRLVNESTGESFTVTVTLADGTQWLAVDTSPNVKTIRKYTAVGVWTNAFGGLDLADERLFMLEPGNNLLRLEVTGAGSTTRAEISWRNRYAGA